MTYGLIGEKLSHSLSPEIHRLFFELTGKKGDYKLFELAKSGLKPFLVNAFEEGFKGLNVTIPYKTEVISLVDELTDEAMKIGAVNTILLGNRLKGCNTDYFGIDFTIKKYHIKLLGGSALVMGSGGAAKAVVAYLEDSGASKVYMASRNKRDAEKKFPLVFAISYEEITDFSPFDIIINTTPVGMFPKVGLSPLKMEQLKGSGFLFDLTYNPSKTKLMELADVVDMPNANGLYMLIAQAVKAQEIWNDEKYGIDLADAILHKFMEKLFL